MFTSLIGQIGLKMNNGKLELVKVFVGRGSCS